MYLLDLVASNQNLSSIVYLRIGETDHTRNCFYTCNKVGSSFKFGFQYIIIIRESTDET